MAGIAAGPAVMAVAGLTHPVVLTPDSAHHWAVLHTVLIPLFPLVGLNLGWLVAGLGGVLPWVVRTAAFGYAVFYPAVDLLAGIGAGRLVELGEDPDAPAVRALFARGNALSEVGVVALGIGCVAAVAVLAPRLRRAVVWALPLLAGAFLFAEFHIYRPFGVTGMALLAVGFAGLLRSRQVADR